MEVLFWPLLTTGLISKIKSPRALSRHALTVCKDGGSPASLSTLTKETFLFFLCPIRIFPVATCAFSYFLLCVYMRSISILSIPCCIRWRRLPLDPLLPSLLQAEQAKLLQDLICFVLQHQQSQWPPLDSLHFVKISCIDGHKMAQYSGIMSKMLNAGE